MKYLWCRIIVKISYNNCYSYIIVNAWCCINLHFLSVTICSAPPVPSNAHIIATSDNIILFIEGTNITFQCDHQSHSVLTAMCHVNRSWSPSPSELDCTSSLGRCHTYAACESIYTLSMYTDNVRPGAMLSSTTQVTITAVVCSVPFFLFGILVGVLCHCWAAPVFMRPWNKKHSNETEHQHSHSDTPAAVTAPVLYEEVKLSSNPPHSEQNIELQKNTAYGPI